jgi:hypothetical protein
MQLPEMGVPVAKQVFEDPKPPFSCCSRDESLPCFISQAAAPKVCEVRMRILEFVSLGAENQKRAAGPEVYTQNGLVLSRVANKYPRVGSRHDCAGEALMPLGLDRIMNADLIFAEIEHQFHRPARKDTFLPASLRSRKQPEAFHKFIERWPWSMAGVQHSPS